MKEYLNWRRNNLGVSVYPYKEDIEKTIEYTGVDRIRYDGIM